MRQVVAIPANQGRVVGVFKQKLQRRRFDVTVAKDRVGFVKVNIKITFLYFESIV
jgi:hypothetical protein